MFLFLFHIFSEKANNGREAVFSTSMSKVALFHMIFRDKADSGREAVLSTSMTKIAFSFFSIFQGGKPFTHYIISPDAEHRGPNQKGGYYFSRLNSYTNIKGVFSSPKYSKLGSFSLYTYSGYYFARKNYFMNDNL